MKQANLIYSLALTVSIFTLSEIISLPTETKAQTNPPLETTIQFVPPTPSDRGRPREGRRRGAASRGDCQNSDIETTRLTALTPSTEVSIPLERTTDSVLDADLATYDYEDVLSLTTEAHPSFWFYVPYELNEETELEFVFQDEGGGTIYQDTFTTREIGPGIVQISLPESLPALTIGEAYQWYFLAHCDLATNTVSPYVQGWIQRIQLDAQIAAQLEDAPELEQASIYATHGIWQDALTILGKREHRTHWTSLLTSVGLADVAEEPYIDCCNTGQAE